MSYSKTVLGHYKDLFTTLLTTFFGKMGMEPPKGDGVLLDKRVLQKEHPLEEAKSEEDQQEHTQCDPLVVPTGMAPPREGPS